MTAPLVPPDIEIPRLPWVPIYADRLWDSTFFAVASGDEFRAAFCLWLKSWNQRPPGSLPCNNKELCRLAELGGDLAKWGKVKRMALRHWIRCDDNRLYHPVIAEFVIDAAHKLDRARDRTSAATANRWKKTKDDLRNGHRNGRDLDIDLNNPPLTPPAQARGDKSNSINGFKGDAALPAPVNPKTIGHSLPCHCANCMRWAALHPAGTA